MVARGDEHRDLQGLKHPLHGLDGLGPRPAVKQVAGEEHHLSPHPLRQTDQFLRDLPQLRPAPGRQGIRQAVKGRVQMQVGGMKNAHLAHQVSRTLSARTHRPVSVSISNTAPSSLAGPEAGSYRRGGSPRNFPML